MMALKEKKERRGDEILLHFTSIQRIESFSSVRNPEQAVDLLLQSTFSQTCASLPLKYAAHNDCLRVRT